MIPAEHEAEYFGFYEISERGTSWIGTFAFALAVPVSYTHLRAHETVLDLVCRLLLEKKKIANHI